MPNIKKISPIHRLYFTQRHVPEVSVDPLETHLADQPQVVSHLLGIALVLPFAELVIHDRHPARLYHHPVRASRQALPEQDLHFVQDAGGAVVPGLDLLRAQQLRQAADQRRRLLAADHPGHPVTLHRGGDILRRADPAQYLVQQGALLPPGVVEEEAFPAQAQPQAAVRGDGAQAAHGDLLGSGAGGLVRIRMPPFPPLKRIRLDLRLHSRPEQVGDGGDLLDLARVVDLPRAGGAYDQLLFRAGKGDVEGVQVVDERVQALPEIILGEDRPPQDRPVADGHQAQAVEGSLLRVAPEDDGLRRLVVDLPIREGKDHDLEAQSLGLVYGQDADRVLPVRGGDRLAAARLVPPFQEAAQVRALLLGVLGDQVEEGLREYLLRFREAGGEVAEEPLGQLVQGLPGQGEEVLEGRLVVRLARAEPPGQHLVGVARPLPARRVLRIAHAAQQGDQETDRRGAAHEQGIVGDDVVAVAAGRMGLLVGQQGIGHARALLVGAREYGDLLERVAVVLQALQDGRQALHRLLPPVFLRVAGEELDPHVSLLLPQGGRYALPAPVVGVGDLREEGGARGRAERGALQRLVVERLQDRRGGGEEGVVEVHDPAAASPIVRQGLLAALLRPEIGADALVQQRPVRVAEAVDALFHVADDQVRPAIRQALRHQGAEVVPLHAAGVLELVDHVVVHARTGLLVDEGGVAAADDLVQQLGRIGDQQDVLLLAVSGDLAGDVGQDPQRVGVTHDLAGRVIGRQVGEEGDDALHAGVQPLRVGAADGLPQVGRRRAGGIGLGVVRQRPEGGCRLFHLAARQPLEVEKRGAASSLEVRGAEAGALEQRGALLAEAPRLGLRGADDGVQLLFVGLQGLLVRDRLAGLLAKGPVTLLEKLPAEREDVLPQAPAASLLDLVRGETQQPAQQVLALGLLQVGQQAIDRLGQDPFLVHLDAIAARQADLAGEGAGGLLEEAVDRADIEGGVVVQDRDQDLPGLLPRLRLRQGIGGGERPEVIGGAAGGEVVQLPDDAALHLVRRLVREGDGQDPAVGARPREEQREVLPGQLMRLARPGGGSVDGQHGDRGGLEDTAFRVALLPEDLQHAGAQVALEEDRPLLGGAAYAAPRLQELSQGGQVLLRAAEAGDQGNRLAAPVAFVQGDAQGLFLFRQGRLLLRLAGIVRKIGIGGVHHAQSRFPVVRLHSVLLF